MGRVLRGLREQLAAGWGVTPRAALAGHWRCGNCGRAHPEHYWADECCGLVKAIARDPMLLDETDRREAVLETELEQARKRIAELEAQLSEPGYVDALREACAGVMRLLDEPPEASELGMQIEGLPDWVAWTLRRREARAEKAERERDEARARATRDNDSMASDRIAAALLIQGERARAEKAEAALKQEAGDTCILCRRPMGWHSTNGAHYACAALKQCIGALDACLSGDHDYHAVGGRDIGCQQCIVTEALAAAREVLG